MMKIESARWNESNKTFAASFSDGITVILTDELEYHNMVSTGLESYYIEKRKWPRGKNLSTRVNLSKEWIGKNKNRYKKE